VGYYVKLCPMDGKPIGREELKQRLRQLPDLCWQSEFEEERFAFTFFFGGGAIEIVENPSAGIWAWCRFSWAALSKENWADLISMAESMGAIVVDGEDFVRRDNLDAHLQKNAKSFRLGIDLFGQCTHSGKEFTRISGVNPSPNLQGGEEDERRMH